MTAYILVDMEIHDREGYAAYPPKVKPLIEKHGGKVTHRMGDFEVEEGDWKPTRMVLIEFPDMAALRAFWGDPDYSPVKDIRLKTAHSKIVFGHSA